MLVFLLSLLWDERTVMLQRSGFHHTWRLMGLSNHWAANPTDSLPNWPYMAYGLARVQVRVQAQLHRTARA